MKPTSMQTLLAGLGLLGSLQMASGQTAIPNTLRVPDALVNTNKPGFTLRVYQGNTRLQPNNVINSERLLSGKAIDPSTGTVFENTATPNDDGSFWWNIPTFINMHEQAVNGDPPAGADNFSVNDTGVHNIADTPEPGIPGTGGSGDYFVMEFTGYLRLPAGNIQFGVNSDDGFRLTVGDQNQPSISRQQLLVLDGTRGFGNTEGNFSVATAGLYPFRLTYWEVGGANSGVEFYHFTPGTTSGNRYLVGDTNNTTSVRVFAEAANNPPKVLAAFPNLTQYVDLAGNGAAVPPAPYAWFDILDGTTTLNTSSVVYSLDGSVLTTTATKNGPTNTFAAQYPTLPASSTHTNTLVYADSTGNKYTNSWTFTVSGYQTINTNYAVASVDTSKPGFKVKIHQMDINRNPTTGLVPNAERQIANGYINPATGQPYENTANLAGAEDGYLIEPTTVNWNQDVADTGSFPGDRAVPGIDGSSANGTDRFVASIETILELKAGPYRFGVNSDDGFRLSFGQGPGDVTGVQLATAGDRGVTDTYADFLIAKDGFYPVRVMWWETGGGAAAEFFVVDLATGNKTLINDPSGFTPIKAYRESANSRPYISRVLPTVNYGYAFPDQDVVIDVTDGALPLDAGSAVLTLNGATQTLTATKAGKVTTLVRDSSVSNLLPSGVNTARLVYSYTSGGTSLKATNDWSFTVPRYIRPIPPANKVLASQVSGSGFKVRAYQIDRSKDANQGNGGRNTGNNMPGPEIELAAGYIDPLTNQPYPNLAATGEQPDGSFITDVFNYSNAQSAGAPANNGGFITGDTGTPGLPGTGSSNFGLDNSVHEFETYLDLKAGSYIMGLNVDDGFTISSSPNPKDTLGTLLGFKPAPGGNNGNPLQNPNAAFSVVVPEDGIYPFRILFWEGGGGVNAEFVAIDRDTGTQLLVNDTEGTAPAVVATSGRTQSEIKAYSTYTGPVRPWTKFSVHPMPYIGTTDPRGTDNAAVTLWQNRQQQVEPGPILLKLGLINGSWNVGDIQNGNTAQRPFGDVVGAVVADLGSSSVGMVLDGASVTPTTTAIPGSSDKLVSYKPSTPLSSSSNHVAGLVYAGTTNYWTFSVITNTTVNPTNKVAGSGDPTKKGFKLKMAQALTSTTLATTLARAEAQLVGSPANIALPGTEPDGTFIVPGILNLNVNKHGGSATENGNFTTALTGNADVAVPGLPGTGTSGNPRWENFSTEITTYLDLPAGYLKFGINGDDGFKVQIGQSGQTNSPIVFTSGDRSGGSADFPFVMIVPEAGLYPVRIVWYQGGGGGNLELFTYGALNGEKILVNADRADSIKAYYAVTGSTTEDPKITSVTRSGGNITIVWTGGGTLESSATINAGWTSTGDSDGSFTEAVAATGAKYYRVKR